MKSSRWVLIVLAGFSLACSDFFTFAGEDRDMIIRGTVTEYASGTPIEGVHVSLEWTPADPDATTGTQHVDATTSETGQYRIEVKLGDVSCSTLYLFIAASGYDASRLNPECKGGEQTFDVELRLN